VVNDRQQSFTRILAALVLALAVSAAACVQTDPTSNLTAIPQTILNDTFSGTIPVGGNDIHDFSLTQGGGVITIALNAINPANTIALITIGFVQNGVCVPSIGPGTALVGQSVSTQISVLPGDYCVVMAAGSNAGVPVTYTIVVSHP